MNACRPSAVCTEPVCAARGASWPASASGSPAMATTSKAARASRVQFAVARKVLDQQEQQGAAAIQLIQAAAKTGAAAGDQLVAAATGFGASLDTYA